jgi:pimeloyl-ACP methyl ester carboxylesterase
MTTDQEGPLGRPERAPVVSRLDVNGLDCECLTWDGGGDTTVLLVHGYLDSAWSWGYFVDALTPLWPDAHLVAFSWRGHGTSERIGAGGFYHFVDYVRDLDVVARKVRRGRLVLVGHSMGGGVSLLWLGARPDRAERAVLIEGGGPRPGGPDDLVERVGQWIEETTPFVADRLDKSMEDVGHAARRVLRMDPRLSEAQAHYLAEVGTERGTDGRLRWRYDLLNRARSPTPILPGVLEAFARRISAPVHWVDGADSVLLPLRDDAVLAAIPDLRHTVLPGAGHMVQHHRPRALARLVSDFARTDSPPHP